MRYIFVALMSLAVLTSACGSKAEAPTPATSTSAVSGTVTVFAASSLTDVFKSIGAAFTKANPGVTVRFNFQSSSALESQIEQAAPADVFASADTPNMQKAVDRGLIEGAPVDFARNAPVLVVPADNRAQVTAAKDLARPGVKVVLAAPDVPIGNYARQIINRLATDPANGPGYRDAVLKNVVSNEANVRAVLAKVELGEADAGIVYRTDALTSGSKVKVVPLPPSANIVAAYPIAVVKTSQQKRVATAFIDFVRGADGQRLLREAGFEPAGG